MRTAKTLAIAFGLGLLLLQAQQTPSVTAASRNDPGYVLGPGDQISVRVLNAEEISDKPMQIDLNGYVRVAMVGRIKVGGLTVAQVETELTQKLKTYYVKPDVSISVVEFRSQPVSVLGAVKNPGIQQVQGKKTIVEMLSLAGGAEDSAGPTLKLTRQKEYGPIPLAGAKQDPSGQYSIAEIPLRSILDANNPEENIEVKPFDVISIPRAETIYVMGQVQKAGGFPLRDREPMSVLKAVSLAGGFDRMAKPEEARILRASPGSVNRVEIPVNVKKILAGKMRDVPLQPEDILYVPDNIPKRAAIRALEAAIQTGTGIAIYRRPY